MAIKAAQDDMRFRYEKHLARISRPSMALAALKLLISDSHNNSRSYPMIPEAPASANALMSLTFRYMCKKKALERFACVPICLGTSRILALAFSSSMTLWA